MSLAGFETYNSIYQTLAPTVGNGSLIAVVLALVTLPAFTFGGTCKGGNVARSLTLSLGLGALLIGCYYLSPSEITRLYAIYTGALLLCAYAIIWGFGEVPDSRPVPKWDLLACGVIVLSTALKFAYLEEWPPVLTDYAATTGAITIENYFYEGPPLRKLLPRSYLEGGGSSFLHGPLLSFLFQYFDFSIFSIRCAEVLASIAALIFFWLWLRISVPSPWAVIGLALFAFSAEHLSQSRMGTFYSVSQSIAMGALWLWAKARRPSGPKIAIGFGLLSLNAAVLGCYKPTTAVWALSAILVVDYLTRSSLRGARLAILSVSSILFGLIAYYAIYEPFFRDSLALRKPLLATDTPIWQKNLSGEISTFVQPPLIAARNLLSNIWYIIAHAADYSPVREDIYGPLYALTMVLGCVGLFSRRWSLLSLCVVVGLLPSLTTFPLDRRSIMVRPLLPLCALLFAREWLILTKATMSHSGVRLVSNLVLMGSIALLPFQGIYRLTRFNGPVGVGPSFGPEYVHEMITHLRSLPPDQSIVVMNPELGADKFRMAFARELYIEPLSTRSVHIASVRQSDNASALPTTKNPTVYAILNEDYRAWVVPWLRSRIPGIQMYAYKKSDRVIYWLGVVSESGEKQQLPQND